ncbi:MAG: type II toxin-antitoxin system RelE family toxin [Vicinamibacterales bacterium]
MPYTVVLTPAAQRDLSALDRRTLQRVDAKIRALATNPRPSGAEKLKGGAGDVYRVRLGDYRILYPIEDDRLLVVVVRIRHRREVYRR